MHFPGFTFGWTLGFLEVLGVTFFSYWERRWTGEGGVRRASLKAYLATTLCLLGSSSLSNKVRREGGREGGRERGRGGDVQTFIIKSLMFSSLLPSLPPCLPPFLQALDYINYPTKVVFRSCKLIPTMVIAG